MRSALPALTLVACALLPQATLAGVRFEVPDYLFRLPEQTYQLIERNFSTLYQQTDFTPQITNSYFNHSDLYRFAGIPLAITPQNGFQMEIFGQLYNKSSQIYAQMSQDLSLYRTLRVDMMGDQSDEVAIGMVNSKTTAVRVIPVPGKSVGDMVSFGGLLGEAPVMPVNTCSPAEFILRGGRIPAPLQSLRN